MIAYNITHIKIYNIKQSIPSHRIDLRDTFIYTNIHLAISEKKNYVKQNRLKICKFSKNIKTFLYVQY